MHIFFPSRPFTSLSCKYTPFLPFPRDTLPSRANYEAWRRVLQLATHCVSRGARPWFPTQCVSFLGCPLGALPGAGSGDSSLPLFSPQGLQLFPLVHPSLWAPWLARHAGERLVFPSLYEVREFQELLLSSSHTASLCHLPPGSLLLLHLLQ